MDSRVKALGRLAALYQLMEYAQGVTLDQARASLHDVETRIQARAEASSKFKAAGQEALRQGDVQEWLLGRSQSEFVQWNAKPLEEMRQARESAMLTAAEAYQASRMQAEKMESVLDQARSSAELESQRLEQQVSDDRYLSRQRWEMQVDAQRQSVAEQEDAAGLDRSA